MFYARAQGINVAMAVPFARDKFWWWVVLWASAGVQSIAIAAEDVVIDAVRRGDGLAVRAQATMRAPRELIWHTLTDYDRFATFIPGLRSSQTLERRGSIATVEQHGSAGFLFFSYPIDVVVESLEQPPAVIELRLLKGNLKQLSGRYQIETAADGDSRVLHWAGVIEPAGGLPPLIGVLVLRASVREQFLAMVQEIERRDEARRTGEGRLR